MMGLTRLQTRYTAYKTTSAEEFNSASRSVKPGLIAAGIVSAWRVVAECARAKLIPIQDMGCHSAAVVGCRVQGKTIGRGRLSHTNRDQFGISGPWWYAAGACVQVLLFAMIAAKLKQNAPCEHPMTFYGYLLTLTHSCSHFPRDHQRCAKQWRRLT